RVLMLEHSIYSVISPEGCASLLWRSAAQSHAAATALRLTAQDLRQLGVIEEVIREPIGGAHRYPGKVIEAVGDAIERALFDLRSVDGGALRAGRRDKFLAMGDKGLH
ncbi:MAG: acetyl-CoA carboxylase carboxyl transferase subunit alpha, partial [Inquilinus sp.]|nr:acetyl-CoA carboxylase carboxyl transferase subunit alpha [Inquilinus sp.]